MGRRRRMATAEMKEIERKISGMSAIDENLDAGSGVTFAEGASLLAEARKALGEYNQSLAAADEKKNVFEAKNKALRAFNKKVLPAVGLKFGADSSEYEMVGGIRESERRKPGKKRSTPLS